MEKGNPVTRLNEAKKRRTSSPKPVPISLSLSLGARSNQPTRRGRKTRRESYLALYAVRALLFFSLLLFCLFLFPFLSRSPLSALSSLHPPISLALSFVLLAQSLTKPTPLSLFTPLPRLALPRPSSPSSCLPLRFSFGRSPTSRPFG